MTIDRTGFTLYSLQRIATRLESVAFENCDPQSDMPQNALQVISLDLWEVVKELEDTVNGDVGDVGDVANFDSSTRIFG